MGSFANSVHVRCDDADTVIAAIDAALRAEGYDSTDEVPSEEAAWGMPSPLRALHVTQPYQNWVGVFDSDMMNAMSLAQDLSSRLETYTIQFMVNDSDSWHYQLFHNGDQLDEFSSDGGYDMEGSPDEFPDVIPMANFANIQSTLEQRMREIQEEMTANMPAEIKAIQKKIEAGKANNEDMQQYTKWLQGRSQGFMSEINGLMSSVAPMLGKTPQPESELEPHVEALRPILHAGITDDQVLEVLGTQQIFAETTLEAFMKLIGVHPLSHCLSYRYMEEYTEAGMAESGLPLAAHLTYEQT